MYKPVLAAICLAAMPVAATAAAPGGAADFIETHVADYSNVDSSQVKGATFGWLSKLFGGKGKGGSSSSSGGSSSGGATDVPAPPVVLIFGAAALALGARAKMKKRARI